MADSSSQQAAQASLAALVEQDLAGIYPHIDTTDLNASLPRLILLVQALTTKYGRVSGALSGRFYQTARVDAGLGKHSAKVADVPDAEQVAKTLGWATHDRQGNVLTFDQAQRRIEGAATKLVQDVGRHTIVDSVHADAKAKAWVRVTEPDPCYFCALLATRGAVYKTEGAAGKDSNSLFVGSGKYKSHDHCRCHAEPIFTAYEPSAQVRQWQADYETATRGVRGGGSNLLNAWRQAYEGRTTN